MPVLFAHRGAAVEVPENTLESFRRAIEVGAGALEMDVHATRDGVVVVAHDADGARMCGVPRALAHEDWTEVSRWDAGHGFTDAAAARPWAGRGLRVPRLAEVLEAFPGTLLNVDLKAPIADEVVALVRAARAEERVCLASFSSATIRRVRALGHRGPTALSRGEVARLLALPAVLQRGLLRPGGAAAQIPVALAQPWVVERSRALGLRVDVWTVNDEATARRMLDLGVDGIMTDDPRRLAPFVGAATAPSR